jgi:uncharacterized phage infection (PIP) family protein YhgE
MGSAQNPNNRRSLIGRALHRMAIFLVAICIGITGTLAWQSPGSDTWKQNIANWARQQGWTSAAKILSPRTDKASEQPNPPAQGSTREAVPPRAAAATPITPANPTSEVQQLEAIARDLASMRQNVEQLAADQKQLAADQKQMTTGQKQLTDSQEQMAADQKQLAAHQEQMAADLKHELASAQEHAARDIADLQSAVKNIQNSISTPPPRPATPARKPPTQPRRSRSAP